MRSPFVGSGFLVVTMVLFVAACTQEQKDKAGQTTTTAASATEQKLDKAGHEAKEELKREWRDLDVHVVTGASDAGAPRVRPEKRD